MGKQPSTQQPDVDIQEKINHVIQEVIRNRADGSEINFESIELKYANLSPYLGRSLNRIRAIDHVRLKAEQNKESLTHHLQEPSRQDDLDFLRKSLKGYDVLHSLHVGGQGIVYKAIQSSTKRTVAIKILIDGPLATPQQCLRFEREVELIARLRHPNIVAVYDSGTIRQRQFLVMEYIDGLPIDDYVVLHRLTIEERVILFHKVCTAVHAAHQHGIIHRDLKPTNILVDNNNQPHVLDFGLARIVNNEAHNYHESHISFTGQIVGTLPFMSPEQLAGIADQLDVRSDIYSLGVVLYKLITGLMPYPVNENRETTIKNILVQTPVGLRQSCESNDLYDQQDIEGINDDLEKILFKSMAKDRAYRYQTALSFAEDLKRYLTGDAVEAKAASNIYILKKTIRRYRIQAVIAAAFFIVLVGGLIGVTVAWQRSDAIAKIAMTGLQMGSFVREGDVFRDKNRLDESIGMYEQAIEIGQYVPAEDPLVQRQLFTAYYNLADLYYQRNQGERAEEYCNKVVSMSQGLIENNPDDFEVRNLLASSYRLRGIKEANTGDWKKAIEFFQDENTVYRHLNKKNPDSAHYKFNLAYNMGWLGECHLELKLFVEAMMYYTSAQTLYKELLDDDPSNVSHNIERARTLGRIAVWHIFQKTAQNNESALKLLLNTKSVLNELSHSDSAKNYSGAISDILDSIERNIAFISKRMKIQSLKSPS